MKTLWVILMFLAVQYQGVCQTLIYESNVVVQTFAGALEGGGTDGVGTQARLYWPHYMAFDASTNLYVSDLGNNAIRKITPDGTVTTIASGWLAGEMAVDKTNNHLWVRALSIGVRVIDLQTGSIIRDFVVPGMTYEPIEAGIAFDSGGNVYLASSIESRILRSTNGVDWKVFVGSGTRGQADGMGFLCSFEEPRSICFDAADNLYVADSYRRTLRKVTRAGVVTTLLSVHQYDNDGNRTNTGAIDIGGICADNSGNILFSDMHRFRKITTNGFATTLAGAKSSDFRDGPGALARFMLARGVAISPSGDVFVSDYFGNSIRRIIFLNGPMAQGNLALNMYPGLTIPGIVNCTYRIESTPQVGATNWTTLATIQLDHTPYLWFDTRGTNTPLQFYRAFLLP